MKRPRTRKWLGCGCLLVLAIVVLTAPVTMMGPAVYLDSRREVRSELPSPDSRWIAQLERITVGGAPSMVVTVRRWWQPNWYLTSCKAVSYYGNALAQLRWLDDTHLAVAAHTGPEQWDNIPPFRWQGPLKAPSGCAPIEVEVRKV